MFNISVRRGDTPLMTNAAKAIQDSKVCIIGRSNCPYTQRAVTYWHELYSEYNLPGPPVQFLNIESYSEAIQREVLINMTEKSTVPAIYVNQRYEGGYSDVCRVDLIRKWLLALRPAAASTLSRRGGVR